MNHCKRCGSSENLSKHHIFPVCFFGKQGNELLVPLCKNTCHTKVEAYILAVESFVGQKRFGTRHRLNKKQYLEIAQYLNIL